MNTDAIDLAPYLAPTEAINSDHAVVRLKVAELTGPLADEAARARALFYFVRDHVRYSIYMISTRFEDFIASTTLERGRGYCVQKAVLLAALTRAAGIPSRLAFAKIRNHRAPAEIAKQTGIDFFPSHGYTQLFLGGRWVSATPAFDKPLCEAIGVPAVEFNGTDDAVLAPEDLAGNRYVEYLEKFEPHVDLPFQWLMGRLRPIWGDKSSWLSLDESKGHRMPSGYVF